MSNTFTTSCYYNDYLSLLCLSIVSLYYVSISSLSVMSLCVYYVSLCLIMSSIIFLSAIFVPLHFFSRGCREVPSLTSIDSDQASLSGLIVTRSTWLYCRYQLLLHTVVVLHCPPFLSPSNRLSSRPIETLGLWLIARKIFRLPILNPSDIGVPAYTVSFLVRYICIYILMKLPLFSNHGNIPSPIFRH